MSSDFRATLAKYAKARAASLLPVEALTEAKERVQKARDAHRKKKAKRENLTHKAVGRLVFASTEDSGSPKPVPYMKLELWDRDVGTPDEYLGLTTTDADGRFEIAYDPEDAGFTDEPDLDLRVIDQYMGEDHLLHVIQGGGDVTDKVFDFGTCAVPYYQYHPEIPLPHILTFDYGKTRFDAMPQSYRMGRRLALADTAANVLGTRLKHYGHDDLTLEEIQDAYRGKTGYQRPATAGESDDERFVYKLLNGSCPTWFTVDEEGRYHVVRNWDAFEMDGVHYLPNVDAVFDWDGERLTPHSITIQEREGNAPEPNSKLAPPATYRPGDDGWANARHVLECNNYMYTQAANHLARGHFNAEQWALAAWRNLRLSPLRELLFPHLQEVMIINTEGESAIFGPDGLITKNGALTETSLVQAIIANADTDWYGWSPRKPLNDRHHFAHVFNLYWNIVGEHVDEFFAEHLTAILRHWGEVKGFSDDVVAHSVPYNPPKLPEGHRRDDDNEATDPDAPRVEVGGELRTVTPFATSSEPDETQVTHLAQVCCYVILHATLWHSWINDTSDALEGSYSQYNPAPKSSAKELTDHISLNLALSQTRYGMLLRNEDGDVPDGLIERLKAHAEAFRALGGYDVRNIRSRINI